MITVIVPAYNAEAVIRRCLDSLLAQTYRDFEIIVVNDGSADNTISEIQAVEDPRIHLINQENAGVSAARNLGIELANGDCIAFVDCDDYVDREYLQTLISLSTFGCLPVVGFSKNDSCESVLHDRIHGRYEISASMPDDYLIGVLGETIGYSCWNKLFSKQLLMEHNIRFRTDLKLGEDLIFVFCYLCHCKCVTFIEKAMYHYCDSVDSAVYASRDQSLLYETTLKALCDSFQNGYSFSESALCSWSLCTMTYVLINPYVSSMDFFEFRSYFKKVKKYLIVMFAARAKSQSSFKKRTLRSALRCGNSLLLFLMIRMESCREKRNSQ